MFMLMTVMIKGLCVDPEMPPSIRTEGFQLKVCLQILLPAALTDPGLELTSTMEGIQRVGLLKCVK